MEHTAEGSVWTKQYVTYRQRNMGHQYIALTKDNSYFMEHTTKCGAWTKQYVKEGIRL